MLVSWQVAELKKMHDELRDECSHSMGLHQDADAEVELLKSQIRVLQAQVLAGGEALLNEASEMRRKRLAVRKLNQE